MTILLLSTVFHMLSDLFQICLFVIRRIRPLPDFTDLRHKSSLKGHDSIREISAYDKSSDEALLALSSNGHFTTGTIPIQMIRTLDKTKVQIQDCGKFNSQYSSQTNKAVETKLSSNQALISSRQAICYR